MKAWLTLLALVIGLLAYANGSAWRYARRVRAADSLGRAAEPLEHLNRSHLVVLGLCLLWAVGERIGVHELGLGSRGFRRSMRWGLLIGSAGSAVIHTFFALPMVARRFTPPPEWSALGAAGLGRAVCGPLLVGSAILEEIAFRGLLHAKLGRGLGSTWALLAGGAIFAAWHLVITWCNLNRCQLPRKAVPILYGGSLALLFGVGVSLGLLRQRTGHVIGGVLAHWLLLVSIAVALNRRRGELSREA
jgi:membrane protease YdiL (CAAX protease family)